MELKSKIESELLPIVAKPSRYLGNEYNAVDKSAEDIQQKVLLCYPDNYDSGIQSFAFEVHYHLLNAQPALWAERAYAPDGDVEAYLDKASLPLFSLETRTPASKFNLLFFYLYDVLCFPSVVNMINLSDLPLLASDRSNDAPLIVAGGPAATCPETIAPFVDIFFPVDSAGELNSFCQRLPEWKKQGLDRHQILVDCNHSFNAWIPALCDARFNQFGDFTGFDMQDSNPAETNHAKTGSSPYRLSFAPLIPWGEMPGSGNDFGYAGVVTDGAADAGSGVHRLFPMQLQEWERPLYQAALQLYRRMDRNSTDALFCFSSRLSRTAWKFLKQKAADEGQKAEISGPAERLSLGYPAWQEVVSVFKDDPFVLPVVAATSRLRVRQNVNLRDEELLDAVSMIAGAGWQQIQLRFMLGLPGERSEDVAAITTLVQKCQKVLSTWPETTVIVFLQGFSALPHTSLQWEGVCSPAVMAEKMEQTARSLKDAGVIAHCEPPEAAAIRTFLARGTRQLAPLVARVAEQGIGGDQKPGDWLSILQDAGIRLADSLQPISVTRALPWDRIPGATAQHLLKQDKLEANQGQLAERFANLVSLGEGVPRDDFQELARQAGRGNSGTTHAGTVQAPLKFGRRGKRVNTTTAAIKRRIRIRYAKTGLCRFYSHPDVIKIFDRTARIARIPIVYSQGLRPSPKISYSPPIPPGIASIAEYLDLEVEIGREVDIQDHLNANLPAGMQVLQYQGIFAKGPSLAAVINYGTYEVALAGQDIADMHIENWLAQESIIVQRPGKQETREIDIRPFVAKMFRSDDKLEIALHLIDGRTARITEVLQSLLAPLDIDHRLMLTQRTGQFVIKENQHLTPFDVI